MVNDQNFNLNIKMTVFQQSLKTQELDFLVGEIFYNNAFFVLSLPTTENRFRKYRFKK